MMHVDAKIHNKILTNPMQQYTTRPYSYTIINGIYSRDARMVQYPQIGREKMVVRQVGAESTSPCTWVKHLADLLRNRVNSQQYSRIYEDWRPKIVKDIEKSDEYVGASSTPAGRGNPSTKEPPTDNNRRR